MKFVLIIFALFSVFNHPKSYNNNDTFYFQTEHFRINSIEMEN